MTQKEIEKGNEKEDECIDFSKTVTN